MHADWITFAIIFGLGLIPVPRLIARMQGLRDLRLVGTGEVSTDAVAEHLSISPAGVMSFVAEMVLGFLAVALTHFLSVWDLTDFLGTKLSLATFQISPVHRAWVALWLLILARRGSGVAVLLGGLLLLAPVPALVGVVVAGLYTLSQKNFKSGRLLGLATSFAVYVMLSKNDWATTLYLVSLLTLFIRHSDHLDQCLEA